MEAKTLLIEAAVEVLSQGARVLLVGGDFDALQRLAEAPVKELVVISPSADEEAPAGETATGAPLRTRKTWRERPSSKDLIIDIAGEAPAEEVARVLKKKGVYLSLAANAVTEALAHQREVPIYERHLLSLDAPGELAEVAPTSALFIASKSPLPTLTFSKVVETPKRVDPELKVALERTQGAYEVAERARLEAEAALEAERDLAAQLKAEVEELQHDRAARAAQIEALERGAVALRGELEELEKIASARQAALVERGEAVGVAKAEIQRLEEELEAQHDELAERRVADKRADQVEASFARVREEMAEEIKGLRARLQAAESPAEDQAALIAARDAAREALAAIVAQHLEILEALTDWPKGNAAPPMDDPAVREAFLASTREAVEMEAKRRAEKGKLFTTMMMRLSETERGQRKANKELAVLKAKRDAEAQPKLIAPAPAPQGARVAALEAALASERALRREERALLERVEENAKLAFEHLDSQREALVNAQQEAAAARLEQAYAEEEMGRLEAELKLRDGYQGELESLLKGHTQMERLLAEALTEAQTAKEEAEAKRRLADQSLALLKAEVERAQGA